MNSSEVVIEKKKVKKNGCKEKRETRVIFLFLILNDGGENHVNFDD